MNTQKLLTKVAVSISAATLAIALGACAHHAVTAGDDYGQVRTEAAAQQNTSNDQVIGTAPAPSNAQNVTTPSTPAVIAGPAKVDSTGRAYTSSTVGSAGNGSGTGTNTNVNMIPQTAATSNVTVTQSPAEVAEVTTPAPVEPAPVPAPVIETPAPEPAPMASATTETPAPEPVHRRLRKD
jgi:outer membrane biosynthesis protein TonB